MPEIGNQHRLSRLLFEVLAKMSASNSTAKSLLVLPEEVLEDVVRSLHDSDDSAVGIESRRVTEEVNLVAL